MHKNAVWQGFLLVITLIVFLYTCHTSWKLYHFYRLTDKATPNEIVWSIAEPSYEDYQLQANYTFTKNNKDYQAEYLLPEPKLNNFYAAEQVKLEMSKKKWTIWFAKNDEKHSQLIKKFPMKESIYTLILWGLLIYFYLLGLYVAKRQ